MISHIEGMDEALRMLENAPEGMNKAVKKTLRDAGKKTASYMRRGIPKRWRGLIKYQVEKSNRCYVGLFNRGLAQGHQNKTGEAIPDWFKAYWLNYGTLNNRAGDHHFQYPVKRRSKGMQGGIEPQGFYERAESGADKVFTQSLTESLDKLGDTIYSKK